MRNIKPSPGTQWLILGDFNLIYKVSDKNNRNLNRRFMGQFKDALDKCDLREINLQNRNCTWSNERRNPTLARLDHVFCNAECMGHCFRHTRPSRALHVTIRPLPDPPRQSELPEKAIMWLEREKSKPCGASSARQVYSYITSRLFFNNTQGP